MFELNDILFFIVAAIVIISAILALESRDLIYGAVSLSITFVGVSLLFILLGAIYVAIFQIAMYIGAVVVLILFTVMVVGSNRSKTIGGEQSGRRERAVKYGVTIIAGLTLIALLFTMGTSIFAIAGPYDLTLIDIGYALFSQYGLVFVIMGLVVASSLMGALTLAKIEQGRNDNDTDN
ncbi:MAG: NADH-quinone oxidoreductase subunit J [Candidatus Hodarchaeota archaeon]